MITSLLAAVDSSAYARSAQEQAVALGKAYQARTTGLYVLESFRTKSERILDDLRSFVTAAGLPVDTRTEEGVPSQIIADIGGAHDLIVMGKRGHSVLHDLILGSTAEQLMRSVEVPVLLVP